MYLNHIEWSKSMRRQSSSLTLSTESVERFQRVESGQMSSNRIFLGRLSIFLYLGGKIIYSKTYSSTDQSSLSGIGTIGSSYVFANAADL
ncbi:hypothetical protein H5410_040438 [Solanum commersonii]|uniref:Uncharacterized protein n=1 Tax=Solanum commersonii TaxID=4109 RepID=A0A9J5XRE3_SOLCO|nr:hypothetical protein H5410_040438 [Solanum commersonii]